MLNLRATLKMETVASLGLGLLLIGISEFPRMKQHNFLGDWTLHENYFLFFVINNMFMSKLS